jgi:hypothetical protein
MSNSQVNNLASEIVLAKSAASAATAKVTRLLNDVYAIKSFNLDISNNLLNLNKQLNNINELLNNLSLDTSSNNIDELLETNISFLSSQDVLFKNDLNFNTSLIDTNNIYINRLETKINNLVNILNNQPNLNLNININTL